ncbi:MAG: hypothetical protein ACE5EP_03650 [Candidatus Methylomirabilales bacterium]
MRPEINFRLDPVPIPASGTSTGDAIVKALEHARSDDEIENILTTVLPFVLTIKHLDREGILQCVYASDFHTDSPPREIEIAARRVEQITNLVTDELTRFLPTKIESEVKANIEDPTGGASAGAIVRTTGEITSQISGSITRSIVSTFEEMEHQKYVVAVLHHAKLGFEKENPYGWELRMTVGGKAHIRQRAEPISQQKPNADVTGSMRRPIFDDFTLLRLDTLDVDCSLDPRVVAGPEGQIMDRLPREPGVPPGETQPGEMQ